MRLEIDWSKRGGYVSENHGIEPAWADEAVRDVDAVWLQPDPASRSGLSVRVIGWSRSARDVPVVILVDPGADPTDRPHGSWWGSNAWRAGDRDRRLYGTEEL